MCYVCTYIYVYVMGVYVCMYVVIELCFVVCMCSVDGIVVHTYVRMCMCV